MSVNHPNNVFKCVMNCFCWFVPDDHNNNNSNLSESACLDFSELVIIIILNFVQMKPDHGPVGTGDSGKLDDQVW